MVAGAKKWWRALRDYELFQLIKPLVDSALAAESIDVVLTQSYQPTQQGVSELTQVFMQKLSAKRYGWVKREDIWNAANGSFDHRETQNVLTVFQVGCITVMSPSDTVQLSSADILDVVAACLQSDIAIQSLVASGCGIERVTDIQNPFFKNERDRYQASPSFDFTLAHKQVTLTTTPLAYPIDFNVKRV